MTLLEEFVVDVIGIRSRACGGVSRHDQRVLAAFGRDAD
jgi:hypothetical protein